MSSWLERDYWAGCDAKPLPPMPWPLPLDHAEPDDPNFATYPIEVRLVDSHPVIPVALVEEDLARDIQRVGEERGAKALFVGEPATVVVEGVDPETFERVAFRRTRAWVAYVL